MSKFDAATVEAIVMAELDSAGVDRSALITQNMTEAHPLAGGFMSGLSLVAPDGCAALTVELRYVRRDDPFARAILASPGTGRAFFEWDWLNSTEEPPAANELPCIVRSVLLGTYVETTWRGGFEARADCGDSSVAAVRGFPWLGRFRSKNVRRFSAYPRISH